MFASGIPGTALAALAGGALLGTATVAKLAVTGRILGISGSIKGAIVGGDTSSWRAAFLAGLFAAGAAAAALAPGVFQTLPATYTVTRAAVGGLLVGAGAGMGNGCTSGHGVCGNARKSVRSLVFTLTFMVTGAIAALLTHSAAAAGAVAPTATPLSSLPASTLIVPAATLAAAGIPALLLVARFLPAAIAEIATELWVGVTAGLGLSISGMVKPANVVAFLSPGTPVWDPALMMVMGSALLVSFPAFQGVIGGKWLQKPVLREKFDLPSGTTVDNKLVLGGALFGVGWGISGMCPGPALVAAAAGPAPQLLAYLAAMVLGIWGQQFVKV